MQTVHSAEQLGASMLRLGVSSHGSEFLQNKAKLQKFSALKTTRGADSEIHNMSNSVVERASICCGLYE